MNARSILSACLLACASLAAFAQGGLPDPTRPPAAMVELQAPASPAVTGAPVLQSVLISRERKSAIISGRTVELGGKYGEARLVGLTESGAVLQGPEGRTVLHLLPGAEETSAAGRLIEKRPAASPPNKPDRR